MTTLEPYLGRDATGIPISNSEIQMFKKCRRRWWLTYYLGRQMKSRDFVGPLPLGTRVHRALEAKYSKNQDVVEAYNQLFEIDKHLFIESGGDTFADVEDKFYSEGELGRLMVEGYEQWITETAGDAEYIITSVEESMSYSILDGKVSLVGKTDLKLLDRRDNSVYIGDFKTAVQLKPYFDVSHMSEQLMLYTLLASLTGENLVSGGVYIILKKTKRTSRAKPPFYEKITVRFNEKTLQNFWTRVLAEVSDIVSVRGRLDAGEDHKVAAYPSPTNECVWSCPFFNVCPMFDDGSDALRWLDFNTEVGDPYARYDEGDDDTPES